MAYDGSIRIDTRIDERGFNRGIKSLTAGLSKFAAAVGIAFGVNALVNFGKTAVDEASNLAAAMTGLQSVLSGTGRSFSDAKRFIDDYISDGLVPATNAINAYKNLALRGYDDTQIQQTLAALKDSAAFGRQSSLSLGQAVQSATEGLKNENSILVDNAGVTKNVAKMWQDYAKSLGTTVESLTKQQKIQAEVNGILEETRFQTGDAAKLAGGYAGQVSALGTSFYNLRVALGNAIIPALAVIIPYLKAAVDWMVVLLNQFAQFVQVLFGVQASVASAASDTEQAADAVGDLADNTQAAEKAAKGALAAFDDLNVLQTDTGPAAIEITPVEIAPGAQDEAGLGISDELTAKVEAFKTKLMELLGPAIEAFDRLKLALAPLGETLWSGLKWAWDNILVPIGKWAVTDALPAFLDLLAAGAETLNKALIALRPLGVWLWEELLQPLGEWAGAVLLDALEWLVERLHDLGEWIDNNQETVQSIAKILGVFAAAWLIVTAAVAIWTTVAGIAAGVTAAFGAAVAFLASPIGIAILAVAALIAIIWFLISNWEDVKRVAGEVWDWIVRKWNDAGDWFKRTVTEPVKKWFDDAWRSVKQLATAAWAGVVSTWQDAKTWFSRTVTEPIKSFFDGAWTAVSTTAGNAWTAVKTAWGAAGAWIETNVTGPVKAAFETALDWVGEKWSTVFGGLGEIVRGAVNTMIDLINAMTAAVADGINSVIGNLNALSFTVPDWVPGFGGQAWGLSLGYVYAPQIPRLATGAVIPPNAEFMAVLGDQRSGRNIEAPEALLREIIGEQLGKIEADIRIEFGGTLGALVRELKPEIDRENVRVGRSLVRSGTTI